MIAGCKRMHDLTEEKTRSIMDKGMCEKYTILDVLFLLFCPSKAPSILHLKNQRHE